jgi:putative acetyltransferase
VHYALSQTSEHKQMNIELRRAEIDDLEAIHDLFVETVNQVCAADYNPEQLRIWTSGVENRSQWINKLTDQYFIVATAGEQIVGFGSLANANYVDFMYVHKDYQRRGIADKLFTSLEDEARRHGAKILKSDVSKTAKGFFEKKGFKTIADQTKTVNSIAITNYRMEKDIRH